LRTILCTLCACVAFAQAPARKLTLSEASAMALRNNPRIALDALAPAMADAATTGIRSALYPAIVAQSSAVAALNDSRLSAGALNNPIIFSRLAFGVSGSYLLSDFGRTSNLVESAKLRADSLRQSVQATRSQILFAVHRAFFSALRARKVKQVSDSTLSARQLLLDQVATLSKNGLKSTLDVSFAEVNVSEARLSVLGAQNEFDTAIAELSALLGFPEPQPFDPVEVDLVSDTPPTVSELSAEALKGRPEMAALRIEREAAVRFAMAEDKLSKPTIAALASAGGAPLHSDRLVNRYAAAGVTLNLPVFNGHLFDARKLDARLRVQAVDQRIKEFENVIAREVAIVAINADMAFRRIALTSELARQSASSVELAQERYNLGLSSFVELSQAQLNQTTAEIRNAVARYDYQMLRSAIDFQLGRLR